MLKVLIEPKPGLLASISGQPRFVTAQAVTDYRERLQAAEAQTAKVKADAAQQISAAKKEATKEVTNARANFPKSLKFDYKYAPQPIGVSAISRRQVHVYPSQPKRGSEPVCLSDGKASLVQFEYDGKVYLSRYLVRFSLRSARKICTSCTRRSDESIRPNRLGHCQPAIVILDLYWHRHICRRHRGACRLRMVVP